MNLENLVRATLDLISAYPYASGAIMAVVAVLTWFNLKLVLKAVATCLILGAIAYVVVFIVNLASTGIENTEKFRGNPDQAIDRFQK